MVIPFLSKIYNDKKYSNTWEERFDIYIRGRIFGLSWNPIFSTWQLHVVVKFKMQRCKLHAQVDPSWPEHFVWAPSCATPLSNKLPQRLHLSPWYGHVTLISGFLVLTAVNWHQYPVSPCELLCDLTFVRPAWLRSPCLRDVVATAAVGDRLSLRCHFRVSTAFGTKKIINDRRPRISAALLMRRLFKEFRIT